MKTLTIAKKLALLTGVGILLLLLVAFAGRSAATGIAADANRLAALPAAIRAASDADMAHDASFNAAVLATTTSDPELRDQALGDIVDNATEIRTQMLAARKIGVSAATARAVDGLLPEIDRYRELGSDLADAVRSGADPTEAMSAFQAQFKVLEEQLPAVADAVEAADRAQLAHAKDAEATASRTSLGLSAFAVLALSAISWVISKSILRPIRRTAQVLSAVADGDLTQRVEVHSRDEVAQMADALNRALGNLSGAISEIGMHSSSLSAASEELTAVSSQLASSAQETSNQADVVASAAGQVSENVAVVAAGTGEMNASIQEISHGAQDAVSVADQAAQVAQATNDTVNKLGVSSAEIGNVVKVITSIAEQTNLLALNATIEAARAGEAGKGFAVVAHEVKELASATAAATADISERIGAIQTDAADAVRAIGEITDIIGRVGETQASIASAVEEQTATTTEIGRNVAQAADNSNEIARNISSVAQAAQDASTGATNTLDTASELSRMAGELQVLVAGFRC